VCVRLAEILGGISFGLMSPEPFPEGHGPRFVLAYFVGIALQFTAMNEAGPLEDGDTLESMGEMMLEGIGTERNGDGAEVTFTGDVPEQLMNLGAHVHLLLTSKSQTLG
jgi:hypothetical protein